MKNTLNVIAIGLMCGTGLRASASDQEAVAQRMNRYNVVWNTPAKDASDAMPIGNGDISAVVYAIENGDLYLLMGKNDALTYEGDIFKTGRVKVSLSPNPFAAGKPVTVDTDYFGQQRNPANPVPGPFEQPAAAPLDLKVWPQHENLIVESFKENKK